MYSSMHGYLASLGHSLPNPKVLNTNSLMQNIFLTGSPSLIPGLAPRLYTTLRPLLPPEMKIEIRRAEDPGLDAWRGMARFANALAIQNQTQTGLNSVGMTKVEYEEYGGERIKRWWGGNWNGGY